MHVHLLKRAAKVALALVLLLAGVELALAMLTYDYKRVDTLAAVILSDSRDREANFDRIMRYGLHHSPDGCDSTHYCATLYYLFKQYPQFTPRYQKWHNRLLYKKILVKIQKHGFSCFDTYYPDGYRK